MKIKITTEKEIKIPKIKNTNTTWDCLLNRVGVGGAAINENVECLDNISCKKCIFWIENLKALRKMDEENNDNP